MEIWRGQETLNSTVRVFLKWLFSPTISVYILDTSLISIKIVKIFFIERALKNSCNEPLHGGNLRPQNRRASGREFTWRKSSDGGAEKKGLYTCHSQRTSVEYLQYITHFFFCSSLLNSQFLYPNFYPVTKVSKPY